MESLLKVKYICPLGSFIPSLSVLPLVLSSLQNVLSQIPVRLSSNKKSFPVHRPGGLKRAYWNFFFMFSIFLFFFLLFPLYILVKKNCDYGKKRKRFLLNGGLTYIPLCSHTPSDSPSLLAPTLSVSLHLSPPSPYKLLLLPVRPHFHLPVGWAGWPASEAT